MKTTRIRRNAGTTLAATPLRSLWHLGFAAAALLVPAAATAAENVPIVNPSFEDPVQADGTFTASATGWTKVGGATDAGVANPAASDFTAEAPDGQNIGYIFGGPADGGLAQVLAGGLGTFLADANYSLTVKVGNSLTYLYDGYRVQLLAGGTLLAEDDNTLSPAADSFVTATVNYAYNAGLHAGLVGQPLEVRLLSTALSGGTSGETEFDDVKLTVALPNPVAVSGGPYTVFIGGSLGLNGSASLPSDGATISTYEWDLDNDGDFDEAITGATPAAISQADLVATYGMELGSNTIKLKVTDSAEKTSTVETTVSILPATAVVYEPFAYAGTILNGAGGTSEVGLTGTWSANTATGLADNLPYGALVTRGAGIGNFGAGGNTFGGRRFVDASALAGNGLLNDGATLWFSVIMGYDSGGNRTNTRLAMVLGDESLATSNFSYYFPTAGSTGLGVTMGRVPNVNGRLVATQFRDSTFGTGSAGNVFGTLNNAVYPGSNANRDIKLVVGRITWGADSDTIDIFVPDENLQVDLNTPHSTLTVTVDQSGYDTISFARGDRVVWDEIRFGATYASVTETGSYWDLNGSTAGSGSATPSGTWGTDPNWNEALDGTGATSAWAAGGTATFSAGDDATGEYTITVDGTQDIGGIIAEDGTVTVSGGTALRLTTSGTVSVSDGLTATISTPFTEDAAGRVLGKAGLGTAILAGDNSGVTGGMFLGGGATQFESPLSIAGSAQDVTIATAGAASFGTGFDATSIATALGTRIVPSSTGVIAADDQAATDFDFNTPGLTGIYLGAIGDVTYTGTLTPNGTTYRLGGGGGTLTMGNTNALTGANSLTINVGSTVVLGADNDYTGPTTVPGGATLRIMGATATSAIAVNQPAGVLEIGADGALGAGTLTINGGFGSSPIILAVGGEVVATNPVTLAGNVDIGGVDPLTLGVVTMTGNRTITNNNTTSTTTLAGLGRDGTNNRNATLSGNGSTTVNGAVELGTGTVTKNGNGTLTLNGANTYTGATAVNNAGTLLVNGDSSAATGTVTVNNTATIGGGGTIGGNVTVTGSANIAPGASVGELRVNGLLTISALAGGTGLLRYDLGPIASSDKIIAGTLNIGTGALGLGDFSFNDLGGLENGTYTLISSGGLTGSLAADTIGTLGDADIELMISENDIVLQVSGLGGGTPYGTWSGGAAADGDANGDGVKNGVAWALGAASPHDNAIGLLPTIDNASDPDFVLFRFNRSDLANDDPKTTITVEYGSTLAAWTPVGADTDDVKTEVTPGSPADTVVVKLRRSTLAAGGMLFARLKVTIAP